jgi:bifunctional DNA-binding transcriptional regulator/antitoxin component of YhaV-PrlF toxin-antitoxin module
VTATPRPAKVPRAAGRAPTRASRTRAHNRDLLRLLRAMFGTQPAVEAEGRVELPGWVLVGLGLEAGDRLDFVVAADVLAFCPARLRSYNRGTVLADRSVRLPTAVLDYAASGPLILAPLAEDCYRLCRPRPAQEPATATAAGWQPPWPAAVSAAGRLLLPAAVVAGLGVQPGDVIVFGPRPDGTFAIQALRLLIERTSAALRDLVAGHAKAEEQHERQLAEARERAVGDPLAGTWRPM